MDLNLYFYQIYLNDDKFWKVWTLFELFRLNPKGKMEIVTVPMGWAPSGISGSRPKVGDFFPIRHQQLTSRIWPAVGEVLVGCSPGSSLCSEGLVLWSSKDGAHHVLWSTVSSFGWKGNDSDGLDRWSSMVAYGSGWCAVLERSSGM
jgi:hypothetical protein